MAQVLPLTHPQMHQLRRAKSLGRFWRTGLPLTLAPVLAPTLALALALALSMRPHWALRCRRLPKRSTPLKSQPLSPPGLRRFERLPLLALRLQNSR